MIRLKGFSVATTLHFAGYLVPIRPLQYYEVVDPTASSGDGFILVTMAGGTRQFTADDVEFAPRNEAPAFAADAFAFALPENNAPGAFVGAAPAADLNTGDTPTDAIVENADADPSNDVPFAVDAAGNVTATPALGFETIAAHGIAALDFEAQASWGFTFQAADAGALADTAAVKMNVEERTLDFVTANAFGDSVSVLLGDGAGGFTGDGAGGFINPGPPLAATLPPRWRLATATATSSRPGVCCKKADAGMVIAPSRIRRALARQDG